MKKVISILLAVATFAFAAPALAVSNNVSAGSRNGKLVLQTSINDELPVFRTGDTVNIHLSGLTAGTLTLVTYKYKTGDAGDDLGTAANKDNIQYIDQYTVPESGVLDVPYTVSSTEAGVYYARIYNQGITYTAYYRMGDVTVKSVASDGTLAASAAPYKIDTISDGTYSIGFVGKATLARGDRFEDAGVNLGFTLHGGSFGANYNYTDAIDGARIDSYFDTVIANNDIEVAGSYSVIYGMTVYNVPDMDTVNQITATAESDIH